jgi:selenocysteine lyase/cysteine desulfurase
MKWLTGYTHDLKWLVELPHKVGVVRSRKELHRIIVTNTQIAQRAKFNLSMMRENGLIDKYQFLRLRKQIDMLSIRNMKRVKGGEK